MKCLPFVINAHVTCLEITTSKRNVTVSMEQRERGRRGEEEEEKKDMAKKSRRRRRRRMRGG